MSRELAWGAVSRNCLLNAVHINLQLRTLPYPISDVDVTRFIPDVQSVTGKAVLVTGGTSGIGRATVRLLAAQGARVLTFGRDEVELQATLAEIDGEVHGVVADVSRLDDVREVFAEVDRYLDGLDVLVNNAALMRGDFRQQALEDMEYVVRTNVVGYLACAQEAVERMQKRGSGHVVLIGSMSADLREEEKSTYVATKGAIQAFSESLRKTVNPEGIKVSLIEPGRVATDLVGRSEEEMEEAISKLEMLRPEDVAAMVLYTLVQPRRCDVVSVQLRPLRQVI